MENLLRDLLLAARALRRAPAFAATAVLSLAAGIFVIASTFAVTNAYLIRAMPFPAAKRLVIVSYAPPGENEPRGIPTLDWSTLSDVIEWADVSTGTRRAIVNGTETTDALGLEIVQGGFEPLGVRLIAGRTFRPDEHRAGSEKVIIVSPPLLRGRPFDAATPMFLNIALSNSGDQAMPYRIIGVLEPSSKFARNYNRGDIEFVIPQYQPRTAYMVRLREGATIDVAARRLTDAIRRLTPAPPANWPGVQMASVQASYVEGIRPILMAVTAAAALILLIVAANVAVLVVLRTLRREREVAVRVALGAGAREIARMLGAEAVILCGVASVLGGVLAAIVLGALGPVIETRLGRPVPGGPTMFNLDATVLLVTGAVALGVAVLLAFAPLMIPLARRFERALRSGARAGSDGPGVRRARFALVAVQVAASVTLLFGGGLIVRSVRNLMHTDFGYDAAELVRMRVRFPNRAFPDSASMARYQLALESAVQARTGSPVGFATIFQFFEKQPQRIETGAAGEGERRASVNAVGSRYFDVVGMKLRSGRVFEARDALDGERVAILSEALARKLWPDGSAVGRQIRTGADMNSGSPATVWRTVIGVVNDVRETHRDIEFSDVYLPAAQMGTRFASVLGKPGAHAVEWSKAVREVALDLNPFIDVAPPTFLADGVRKELEAPMFLMSVLTGLALLAVGIALLGIYGVTAYAVEQRRREIAVRSALGATPKALVRLFIVESGRVVAAGIAAGTIGAVWIGHVLRNQVYGVPSGDLTTMLGAAIIIAIGCSLAAWLPARRAAVMDTAAVLRSD